MFFSSRKISFGDRRNLIRKNEISTHGVKCISHAYLSKEEEKQIINDCYSSILKLSGHSPLGWHTKSSTSPFTRDLLIEHGGFIFDSNAYNDNVPYLIKKMIGSL